MDGLNILYATDTCMVQTPEDMPIDYFFLESNYIKPIYRMLASLKNYRVFSRNYGYTFDGDDQLSELNTEVKELTEENRILRKRISAMKLSSNKDN